MASHRLYKISFLNQGQVYEVYARRVVQGGLLGFVEKSGPSRISEPAVKGSNVAAFPVPLFKPDRDSGS